jgi:type I restriction enzyme S subunit
MVDEYVDDGIPFLRSQNIVPFGLQMENIKFVPPTFHQRIRKSALQPGDVAVVRTGYAGTAAVVPDWLGEANCADLVVITPGRDLDAYFLAALFNSAWGIASVGGKLVGSAQQHFNVGSAKRMDVRIPPLPIQRKITAILSAYDDLIENNNRRIKLLEEIAQRIYREWFVDFRYPGYEDVPLGDSEVGPAPVGWTVAHLQDLASVAKGLSYKGEYLTNSGSPMANLKCFDPAGGFRREGTKPYSGPFKEKHSIKPGDLIVANTDLTQAGNVIGSPAIVPRRGFEDGGLISHHLFVIRPKRAGITALWLYHVLRDGRARAFSRGRASGTTVLGLRTADYGSYPVLVPSWSPLQRFSDIADKSMRLGHQLHDATDTLRATRDHLLPRLISGEIDVEHLDIAMLDTAA